MSGENAGSVIGRSAHVRGRVTGDGDLEIHGHVEGEVTVSGELIIETHGLVGANLSARRVIVRGAVRGDLVADESVSVEDGARIVGDVRAPRVSISQGALVRGYVQTAASDAAPVRAATKVAAAPARAPKAAASAPVRVSSGAHMPTHAVAPRPATLAGVAPPAASAPRRGPPPPVVPALKKGAKGVMAKKRG